MKAQILKHTGLTEKQFYAKYKTQKDFENSKEGKTFKKAQMGTYIGGNAIATPKMINYRAEYDVIDKMITGYTDAERQAAAEKAAAAKQSSSGGGFDISSIMGMFGGSGGGSQGGGSVGEGIMSSGGFGAIGGGIGGARHGKHIPRAYVGAELPEWAVDAAETATDTTTIAPNFMMKNTSGAPYANNTSAANITPYTIGPQTMGKMQGPGASPGNYNSWDIDNNGIPDTIQQAEGNPLMSSEGPTQDSSSEGGGGMFDAMKGVPIIGGIVGGMQALGAQKKAKRAAKQAKLVSDVTLKASATRPEETKRRYVTPWDNPIQAGQMFPTYGVGTNVLARNGKFIRRAQDGTIETPQIDSAPTDWYEEGMDKDTYYALKQQLDDAGYEAIAKPDTVNVRDMQAITEEQSDPNQMSDEQSAAFMETYNRDKGASTATFDSKSARDNWVQKTGLPWSEAKRLGYTNGSAKDNTKLLSELNDPRFKKENLRREAPKSKSQGRTPVQHTDTPTGRLTPIKKPLTMDEYFKGKPKYKGNATMLSTDSRNQLQREQEAKRSQAEYNDQLGLELPLYYMANPSKAIGDLKSLLNPMFTSDDETSKGFRKEVMANRYNPNQASNKRLVNHIKKGLKLTPKAAVNVATVLSTMPYTTFEPLAVGIGEGAGVRAAGYLGQGAKQIGQGAAKQLTGSAAKQIGPGYVPNFTMYRSGGEIQNTYAPGYLYDDLGYEPLNDSNVKQYYHGGGIPRAQYGLASAGGGGFGENPYGGITSSMMGSNNNAGSQIGGSIGSIFGPVGGAVGTAIGGMLDTDQDDIDKYNRQTKTNMEGMAMNNMIPGIHSGYKSHMKDGGYMNPEYNPQVITMFGDLDEQEVYDYAHDGMQSLRAGGHVRGEYTPISNRGMEQYAMGGEVKTTWGGHAETISHNPYMPGTGETIMFRGKSHDESDGNGNTGIGVKYGKGAKDSYTDYAEYGTQEADADVEVERGEPAAELQDANGEKNLTVYGNLKIPNQYIDLLGDPNAKGKKFKNYVNDLSKIEAKQNKIVESSVNKLNALNPQTQFDKLKLTSLQASIEGANMKLKDLADKKMNAAYLQNAINDTAEENSLVADDLAKGKVKVDKEAMQEYAKYGKSIPKAQKGDKIKGDKMTVKEALAKGYKLEADGKYHLRTKSEDIPEKETRVGEAMAEIPKGQKQSASGTWGKVTPELYQQFVKDNSSWFDFTNFDPKKKGDVEYFQRRFNEEAAKTGSTAKVFVDGDLGEQTVTARIKAAKQKDPSVATDKVADIYEEDKVFDVNAKKRNALLDLAGQVLPFFRPTDQEGFDMAQLYPEMYALSNNQLEPVQAQSYQPDLATPYDISYQDQLNANQADYNASQKMVGYNPAAQSVLNAQKYAANTGVLGEQFRANQAMKMGVYDQNRNTLNEAKLKNLDIFDRQYTRQEQAKSNTKAVAQAALNSISDKYAKNKLENRELGIYENLYNYRYDDKGRAINMNAPWQANLPNMYDKGSRTANMRKVYDEQGNFLRFEPIEETKTVTDETLDAAGRTTGIGDKKNGGKVKARNGSIVSSYKNL